MLGAVGQPQLRGPHPPRGAQQLPGQPAAVRGLRAGRPHGPGPVRGAAGPGRRRQGRLPQGHLALAGRDPRRDRVGGGVRHVPQVLRRGVRGRRELGEPGDPRGRPLRLGRRVHLRQAPALLRGHGGRRARGLRRHQGRAHPGQARRLGDHRPHLARRRHQEGHARRQVPAGQRRRAAGLQLLRLAPRQPRGDDARHVRQRAPAQPAGARHRGRLHPPLRGRRGRVHLRRGDGVPVRRRPAGRAGRQGVRLGRHRATGRPRARGCWASASPSPRATSASTAPTWWAWASCRCSSPTASRSSRWA